MDQILYDISIIRLPEKLTFNDYIRPVCVPNRKYLAETFENQVFMAQFKKRICFGIKCFYSD